MGDAKPITVIGRNIAAGGLYRCCIQSINEDSTTPNEDNERIECKHCGESAVCYSGVWQWFNGVESVEVDHV